VFNIDMSEVDQVSVPFTVTTSPAAPAPASGGVGISINRGDLFNNYTTYITGQGAAAKPFLQSFDDGQPYRILSPQDILNGPTAPSGLALGNPQYSQGGTLASGTTYYYWVTATSGKGHETSVSNIVSAVPNSPTNTVNLVWDSFESATGYNVYRSTTNDSA